MCWIINYSHRASQNLTYLVDEVAVHSMSHFASQTGCYCYSHDQLFETLARDVLTIRSSNRQVFDMSSHPTVYI